MTRHIVLGNGSLLVNLDKWLQVRDIYYPNVGQENHVLGHAHKIGVFSDNILSWINEDIWEKKLGYMPHTLVSDCSAKNHQMHIELKIHDCVDCAKDVFFRRIEVKNTSDHHKEVLVFFHHDFHLYGDGIGDTAGFDPLRRGIFHYKRNRYFFINALHHHNVRSKQKFGDIFEYSIGTADYNTLEDAKDGRLSLNAIAQGSVDSICSMKVHLQPNESKVFYYWICAARSFKDLHELNDELMKTSPEQFFIDTIACWQGFLNAQKQDFEGMDSSLVELYKRSLLVVQSQINHNGAIIAANDSDNMQYNKDTYSYVWPRDGALVSIALQKAGYTELTRDFFVFCKQVLSEQGCFLHKYNPDKSLGSSWHPWIKDGLPSLPIQEDGTALVIVAIKHFFDVTQDKEFIQQLYDPLIKKAADFMVSFRDERTGLPAECYDLWEERFGIFSFTTACVVRSLKDAAELARIVGDDNHERYDLASSEIEEAMREFLYSKRSKRFLRRVYYEQGELKKDYTVDSTLLYLPLLGLEMDEKSIEATLEAVMQKLWVPTDVGGMCRYEADHYHRQKHHAHDIPGNPWFICTIWLARWHVHYAKSMQDLDSAYKILQWVVSRALSTGLMPEQIHPLSGEALSVSPLTWSHAEFVELMIEYMAKKKVLAMIPPIKS